MFTTSIKRVSKKIVNIFLLLLFLSSYFFVKELDAWYSSSWMYRREVTVTGDGNLYTNKDVLVVFDTATPITASKMQSDCDDLRFVDSDDSTLLTFWVEGGCNTSSTQIWVRIPSMPTGNKTIYMYYGNSSATNAEANWTGNFILQYNNTCPTGWARTSTYDGYFPRGATTYGGTGGASSHNHTNATCTTGGPSAKVLNSSDVGDFSASTATHTHTNATASIGNATNSPPYLELVYCTNSDLNIESGMISLFTSLPSGWTRFSALDGLFPKGASAYGGIGGSSVHAHSITGSGSTNGGATSNEDSGSSNNGTSPHTHTINSGTTGDENSIPAYYTMIFGSKDSTGFATSGLVSMTTDTPPLGWTRYSSLDSKFVIGSTSSGTTGGSDATHRHTASLRTNTRSAVDGGGSRVYSLSGTHYHTCNTYTGYNTNIPNYVNTLFFERNTSLVTSLGSEVSLNVAPTAPTIPYTEGSANPTQVGDLTPEFSAIFNDPDTGNTGDFYQIQVNTASDFSGTEMWDSGLQSMTSTAIGARSPDISYNGTTLSPDGTTYYWRIKFADNWGGVSPWSSTSQFTMNISPNVPTVLYTESTTDPTQVTDLTPEFSAVFSDSNSSDTGDYYQIQVNTTSAFNGTSMWDSGLQSITSITNGARSSDISYNGTTLSTDGTTYYWRIKFADNYGAVSDWSSTGQFTMNTTPNIPSALYTEGASNPLKVTDTTPEFSAVFADPDSSDTGVYYEIEVNTNSVFTGTVMWDSNKTSITAITNGNRSTDISYGDTDLTLNGVKYYWRIRFWDNNDTVSDWSSTANFTMSGGPTAPTSLLTDGGINPSIINIPPNFSAIYHDPNTDTSSAVEIEVNSQSDFLGTSMWDTGKISAVVNNNTRSSNFTYSGTPLLGSSNTKYYWRIRFWDSDDIIGEWSDAAYFYDLSTHFLIRGVQIKGMQFK